MATRKVGPTPDNATTYSLAVNRNGSGATTRTNDDEIGREGLNAFYGHVTETYISKLEWPDAYDTYNEMRRRDPTLRSLINAVKLLARQADWKAEPASDKRSDRKAAEYLQSCLEDMSHTIDDFIDDALSCLPFGWSSFAICYKRRLGEAGRHKSQFDDGRIGWRKFAYRRQSTFSRWELDDTGGFGGWWQLAPPTYEEVLLPAEYLLHFVGERDGQNPEGIALFESAYENWHNIINLKIILGIGWQRTFTGLPVFRFKERPSSADEAAVKATGEGLTLDEKQYVSIPPDVDFSLESTGNTGAMALLETIKAYRAEMLQIVLAEFIMQGALGTGTYGSQRSKSDLFLMAVNGWLDKMAAVWNLYGVDRLFKFEANRFPNITGLPRVVHTDVGQPDRQELAEFIAKVASYIRLGDEDILWIRQQAGMPESFKTEEEMKKEQAEQQSPMPEPEQEQETGDDEKPKPETGEGETDEEAAGNV